MKAHVKVSLVQFEPEWLAPQKNLERMRTIAESEAKKGSELILFPELANTGYVTPAGRGMPPSFDDKTTATDFAVRYIEAAEPIPGPTTEALGEVASKHGVFIVVGICQLHPTVPATLYNSAVLIGPSGVLGIHHKMHIPFMEKHFFYPGNTAEVYHTELGNIGMTVCYDGRFPELTRILALKGAEIVCSIWNLPWTSNEVLAGTDCLKHIAYTRSVENGIYYLACNRSGTEGDAKFKGHSAAVSPKGDIIASSESEDEEILAADLFNEEILKFRAQVTVFQDRKPDLYSPIIEPLSKSLIQPTQTGQ